MATVTKSALFALLHQFVAFSEEAWVCVFDDAFSTVCLDGSVSLDANTSHILKNNVVFPQRHREIFCWLPGYWDVADPGNILRHFQPPCPWQGCSFSRSISWDLDNFPTRVLVPGPKRRIFRCQVTGVLNRIAKPIPQRSRRPVKKDSNGDVFVFYVIQGAPLRTCWRGGLIFC